MKNLKYLQAYVAKHKARVHQLDFIGELLQTKVKNRVFVKLDIRYTGYFHRLLKSIYCMTNSSRFLADELT